MARHILLVLTEPVAGMEDEYNDWYSNTHLRDVLKLDDFVSAQRFEHVKKHDEDVALRRYLAIYEAETDDVRATYARLAAVGGTDAMPMSPAFDAPRTLGLYYKPITEKLTK
jgi:hypothetical protein